MKVRITMKKLMIVIVTVLVTLSLGTAAFFAYRQHQKQQELEAMMTLLLNSAAQPESKDDNVTLTADTLYEIIRPNAKLVSADYTYSNIATVSDYRDIKGIIIPLTTDKVVFTYTGTIYAGIDLKQVHFDVNNESKTIYITLPQPQKIAHEINTSSYQFETVSNSIFTSIDPEEFTSEANAQKLKQEIKAQEEGTLSTNANENAKAVLRDLLNQASVTNGYHYDFRTAV